MRRRCRKEYGRQLSGFGDSGITHSPVLAEVGGLTNAGANVAIPAAAAQESLVAADKRRPCTENTMSDTLSAEPLQKMDAYWREANYLTADQIFLKDNPLLEVSLRLEHFRTRLLRRWARRWDQISSTFITIA